MLSNILEPEIVIPVCCGIAATVTMAIQMGRFYEHKKKSTSAPELKDKYAWFSYGILPVMFGMIGVIAALFVVDSLVLHGTIMLCEVPQYCAGLTIIGAILADIAFRKITDAVYFVTVEEHFLNAAAQADKTDLSQASSDDLFFELLSRRKK